MSEDQSYRVLSELLDKGNLRISREVRGGEDSTVLGLHHYRTDIVLTRAGGDQLRYRVETPTIDVECCGAGVLTSGLRRGLRELHEVIGPKPDKEARER